MQLHGTCWFVLEVDSFIHSQIGFQRENYTWNKHPWARWVIGIWCDNIPLMLFTSMFRSYFSSDALIWFWYQGEGGL